MPEVIDVVSRILKEDGRGETTFPTWVLVETTGRLLEKYGEERLGTCPEALTVSLCINGCELPPLEFLELLEEALRQLALERAKELLADKLAGPMGEKLAAVTSALNQFQQEIETVVGIPPEERW